MPNTVFPCGRMQYIGGLLIVLFEISLLILPVTARADTSYSSPSFYDKWQRADKPVNDGNSQPARSWLWGPLGFEPPGGALTEPYYNSPSGLRQVEYFDKARMELNDGPHGTVTNGLLVRELISGKLAVSDTISLQRRPAFDIPVAGDSGDTNSPTYASFAPFASLNLDNANVDLTGSPVTSTLDRNGNIGTSPELGTKTTYVFFEPTLKHNIPEVFWKFMNQRGNVYTFPSPTADDPVLTPDQPVLGNNPAAPWLDATGYPLTEAYWAKVKVGGVPKDVLIQAFERRVLTFTPANQPAYQVEMGNVGRHYFNWRYSTNYDLPEAGPCGSVPDGINGASSKVKCEPAGMKALVQISGMQPFEPVSLTVTDSTLKTALTLNFSGNDGADDTGYLDAFVNIPKTAPQGIWSFTLKGHTSNRIGVTYVRIDSPVG